NKLLSCLTREPPPGIISTGVVRDTDSSSRGAGMERNLVGFLTVALLLGSAGHSQAGHVYVHQSFGLRSGDGQFLNLLGVAEAPSEHEFAVDALNRRGNLLFISSLAGPSSGDSRFLELSAIASGLSESDVAFLADWGCLGIGNARLNDLIGAEMALAKNIYGADAI